jgi:rare lipoprotein A
LAVPILARSDSLLPRASVVIGCCLAVAACTTDSTVSTAKLEPTLAEPTLAEPILAEAPRAAAAEVERTAALAPEPAENAAAPAPVAQARYHVGRRYEIGGKWYEPQEDRDYDQQGVASWYGPVFHGRLTANGEVFDRAALSAAHPTLPLPSYVRVTNLENDRSVIVRVNDRGPFARDRLIDVSERTASLLGFHRNGTTRVRVEYVERAPLDGNDDGFLLASYRGPTNGEAGEVLLAAAERTDRLPRPAADAPVVLASNVVPSAAQRTRPSPDPAPERPVALASATPDRPVAQAADEPVVAFAAGEPAADSASGAAEAAQILAAAPPADQRIAMAFELLVELEQ